MFDMTLLLFIYGTAKHCCWRSPNINSFSQTRSSAVRENYVLLVRRRDARHSGSAQCLMKYIKDNCAMSPHVLTPSHLAPRPPHPRPTSSRLEQHPNPSKHSPDCNVLIAHRPSTPQAPPPALQQLVYFFTLRRRCERQATVTTYWMLRN